MPESSPQSASIQSASTHPKLSLRRRVFRWVGRFFFLSVGMIVCYALSVWVLGRIPVNRFFEHADPDGEEILLINNGVHADLVIPLNHASFPMKQYQENGRFTVSRDAFEYAIIGWGSRKFYLETETWDDLRVSTVGYLVALMQSAIDWQSVSMV